MIQASCVEEKIYEKQVFKEGLRVVGEKSASTERYVAGQAPLQELLNLGPANEVNLLRKLSNQLELLKEDKVDIIPGILGCSRHDELYKEDDAKPSAKPTNANTDSQKLQQQHLHYPPLQLQAKEKVVIDLTQSPLKPPADSVAPAITESSDEIFSPAVNNIRHYQRRPKISGLEDDDDEDNKSPIVSRAQDYEGESNPLDAKSNESATGLEDLLADIQIDEEEITPERIESCEDDPYFSPQEILNPILVSTSEIEDLKQHEVEQEELQVQGSDLEQGEIREENIVAIITEDHSSQAKTSESGLEDLFANICISNDIPEMSPIPGDANGLPVFATEGSALNLEEDFVDSREKDKRLENSDEYTSEHNIQESVEGTSIEVPSNDPSETTIILEATDHCSQSPSMLQESAILLDISSQDRTGTDCSEYYDGDSNTCLDMGILNLVEMKEIYQNQKAGGLVGSSQMKHSAHSTDQFMNPSIFSPNLILDPNSPALSNTSGIALNEASITRLEENVNEESTPICSNIDTTRRRRGKSTAKRNTSRLESLSQQTPSVYSTIKIKASSVSRTVNTTTAKKNRNSFLCLSVNSDTSDNSPPLINSAVIQPRESLDVDPRKQLTFDQDPDQNVNSSLTDLT